MGRHKKIHWTEKVSAPTEPEKQPVVAPVEIPAPQPEPKPEKEAQTMSNETQDALVETPTAEAPKPKKCVILPHPVMPGKCNKGHELADCPDNQHCRGFVQVPVVGLPPADLSVRCPHCAKMLVIRNKTGMVK